MAIGLFASTTSRTHTHPCAPTFTTLQSIRIFKWQFVISSILLAKSGADGMKRRKAMNTYITFDCGNPTWKFIDWHGQKDVHDDESREKNRNEIETADCGPLYAQSFSVRNRLWFALWIHYALFHFFFIVLLPINSNFAIWYFDFHFNWSETSIVCCSVNSFGENPFNFRRLISYAMLCCEMLFWLTNVCCFSGVDIKCVAWSVWRW